MVVHPSGNRDNFLVSSLLDLAYLGLFLGLRVNEMVMHRIRAAGFREVRQSHGYVIQHLIESERSISELARRMEVTQQAASKIVSGLVRIGILEAVQAEDRRAKRIRLSKRGWRAVKLGRNARKKIEQRLVDACGDSDYAQAKSILLTCLSTVGGMDRIFSRRIRQPN